MIGYLIFAKYDLKSASNTPYNALAVPKLKPLKNKTIHM